jgi:hypothetical protein
LTPVLTGSRAARYINFNIRSIAVLKYNGYSKFIGCSFYSVKTNFLSLFVERIKHIEKKEKGASEGATVLEYISAYQPYSGL